jgi:hypothetical protein
MHQIEKLMLSNWNINDVEPIIKLLPNLKKLFYSMWFDENDPLMKKLIKDPNLKFPSIEEVTLSVIVYPLHYNFDETKKYLADVLKKQCVNIKKFAFGNEQVF